MAERGDNWQSIEIPSDAAESSAAESKPASSSAGHVDEGSHGTASGYVH